MGACRRLTAGYPVIGMLGSGQNPGPFFVLEQHPAADIDCLGKSRKNSYTQPSSSNQVTGRKNPLTGGKL